MEDQLKRLNKFIGNRFCSRREADKIIEEGRVTINGVVRIRYQSSTHDEVRIDGKLIREKTEKISISCFTNQ
jgi:23S rRNA pseudouridine2604 synthase